MTTDSRRGTSEPLATPSRTAMLRGIVPGPELIRWGRDSGPAVAATLIGALIVWLLVSGTWDRLRVVAVFVPLAALLLVLSRGPRLLALIALVAAWWLAVLLARYLPDLINPAPPVSQAVGAGVFFGTPYEGAQIGAVISLAVPTVIALASLLPRGHLLARRGFRAASGTQAAEAGALRAPRPPLTVWLGTVVLAATLVPDLKTYLTGMTFPVSYSTWDATNLTAWQGFVHAGLVPMKDFFYPYGFQWLWTTGSYGPIFQWLAEVAMLSIAAWSLWRLSGGRTWRVLACLLVIMLAGGWAQTWRFLPALLVAVAYAAIRPAQRPRPAREYLVFFAACMLAVFVEPDLLPVGLAGAVMVLVGEIVAGKVTRPARRLVLGLALDAVPVLAAVAGIVLIWLALGTVSGEVRFLGNLSAVSAQSAPDEVTYGPLGLAVLHLDANVLYAAVPALMATLGLVCARFQGRDGSSVYTILLAASGVSLLLLVKHFVRSVGDEVISAAVIALAWSVILVWRRESVFRAAACGAAIAAIFTLLAENGGLSLAAYARTAVGAPRRAARSVLVPFDASLRVQASLGAFAPARFPRWPDRAIALTYARSFPAPTPPFALIGDAPLVYVLLGQSPPYQSELYDASPIAEQHAMLRSLARQDPPYVIWRQDGTEDPLPYQVRDPLVFTWMIANYVPLRQFGTWDILRRRRASDGLAAAFWTSALGAAEEDLGYIPSYSGAAGASSCSGPPGCVHYAVVHGPAVAGRLITFDVTGNGTSYTVNLRARAGVQTYPVRLDRLWFWPLVEGKATLRSLTPGFTVRNMGLRSGDNLY